MDSYQTVIDGVDVKLSTFEFVCADLVPGILRQNTTFE